ncbi:MAG: hypothetical protein GIW95_01195 [Candidatus Eremiobacteraeota bacterium]|nr:hypothetical protein [Candidatus Eremiobacteraeota bacterium]
MLAHFEREITTRSSALDAALRNSIEQKRLLMRSGSLASEEQLMQRAGAPTATGQVGLLALLDSLSRQRHLTVRSLAFDPPAPTGSTGKSVPTQPRVSTVHLEIEGAYRDVLAAVDQIPRELPVVRLDALSLRRAPSGIIASCTLLAEANLGGR